MPAAAGEHGSILILEDDPGCVEFFMTTLESAGYEVSCADTGAGALEQVSAARPRLALLDVNVPGISGYEVCHVLRERYGPLLPIVFVSGARTESFDRVAGLLIGADDYVGKPIAPDELLARIRSLLRRAEETRPATARLTRREREVLRRLAHGQEQGEIATDLVISPKTVATHIERVLVKLEVHSRAQAVAVAYREHLVDAI